MANTKSPISLYPVNTLVTKAKLVPYKHNGQQPNPSNTSIDIPQLTEFYINPESWSESKVANWVAHNIPGRSDPVLQWTSSGARTITFEALVTRDISGPSTKDGAIGASRDSKGNVNFLNKIGSIAQKFSNISGISLDATLAVETKGRDSINLDINGKLNYYRSLTYPSTFDPNGRMAAPPNVVQLVVGSTFGHRTQGARFVVNRVDINITKQTPNLKPIEAKVTFTLTEIVSKNLSSDTNILTDT